MKTILHYDAGPEFRAMLAGFSDRLDIVVVRPGQEDAHPVDLAGAELLLHVLAPVSAAMMDRMPRLRLVQKIGVGTDAIDIPAARQRGIAVANMPGTNTVAVAEMTLLLMLAALRRLSSLSRLAATPAGWIEAGALGEKLGEINGRTIGIVGYGAVARHLTPVLAALGGRVIAHTRNPDEASVPALPLHDVLEHSDILSLHLPARPETRHILDRDAFRRMKQGVVLINTARGSLIDPDALFEALESGRVAAAGLDVFAMEPPTETDRLLNHQAVIATPHLAWLTPETLVRSLEIAAQNASRLKAGTALLNTIVAPPDAKKLDL
jgi:phosphoglycerate dehydrogenase-like enzyme